MPMTPEEFLEKYLEPDGFPPFSGTVTTSIFATDARFRNGGSLIPGRAESDPYAQYIKVGGLLLCERPKADVDADVFNGSLAALLLRKRHRAADSLLWCQRRKPQRAFASR